MGWSRFSTKAAVLGAWLLSAWPAGAGFYDVGEGELAGPPGSLIRFEVMPLAPPGATAFRILYRSTGARGEPVAVSGVVVRPPGANPREGRNVVAWAHPTTGVARPCAPSLLNDGLGEIRGLAEFLDRGYAVAATDYPGLGTAGVHPYLIGESEARAVLNSVRAARAIPDVGASDRFVVWGHSQGGHAALFAGEIAARYAPELRLLGVAAAAPATELGKLFEDDLTSAAGKVLTALAVYDWSKLLAVPMASVVQPAAMSEVAGIGRHCIETVFGELADMEAEKPLQHHFLSADPVTTEPWKRVIDANVPRTAPPVPLFIAQGTGDTIVDPPVTDEVVKAFCRDGARLRYAKVPGATHTTVVRRSLGETVAWIAERFAGAPAPSNCGE